MRIGMKICFLGDPYGRLNGADARPSNSKRGDVVLIRHCASVFVVRCALCSDFSINVPCLSQGRTERADTLSN